MGINVNNMKISEVVNKAQRLMADPDAANCERVANPALLTGVEIELEDWHLGDGANADFTKWWTEHDEGSLRNGREFVLHPPLNGSNLTKAVHAFFSCGATWDPSERASVHIHLDMLDGILVWQFRSLFSLCYALEGSIYRVADENRKWASYSCPLIEMRHDRLAEILSANSAIALKRAIMGKYHEERYYGFNVMSISKHGTVEFRYFPCTTNEDTLFSWINLCHELFTVATKLSVHEIKKAMRVMGVVQFIRTYLPRSAEALIGYTDTEEVLLRIKQCSAMAGDANAAKRRVLPYDDDSYITCRAYLNMIQKVCKPAVAKKSNHANEEKEEVFELHDWYAHVMRIRQLDEQNGGM